MRDWWQHLSVKWRLVPLVAAALVLCIPLVEGALHRQQLDVNAQSAQSTLDRHPKTGAIQGTPSRILIPSLSIDLPVVTQSYSPALQTWPVAPTTANYASETAPANNTHGQTFIYGHNNHKVFGPLLTAVPGTIAYVYTSNGHIFKYAYVSSQDVSPRQTQLVADMAKAPAGLALMTCDGAYFQYRHMMTFQLLQAS